MTNKHIPVELAYATADRQYLWQGQVPVGTTARGLLTREEVTAYFADINLVALPLGVCGKKIADDVVLQSWDRVELYRPLLIDPKENRRRRARQK
ncbi:RnfH family protein [Snodgrassella sp. CFCC 13594]|uniref:RnfH family protein n=1 Tax=Snodgrassella sp. CFCC 13594 TaxID=1775559 RepID=UPI000834F0E4|nr:RnfH family protein [Snodgrassella sp. CFCC 13594]